MNWDGLRILCEHSTLEAPNAGAKILKIGVTEEKDWGQLSRVHLFLSCWECIMTINKQKCHGKKFPNDLSQPMSAHLPVHLAKISMQAMHHWTHDEVSMLLPIKIPATASSQMSSPCHYLGRFSSVVKLCLWLGFLHMLSFWSRSLLKCLMFLRVSFWTLSPNSDEHTTNKFWTSSTGAGWCL